jgi:isocitrate/isopropylmalate dehydrogenase
MNKSDLTTLPEYFDRYINIVKENNLANVLTHSLDEIDFLRRPEVREKENYAYAEGKWTIKELLQHVIDTERIMTYRALRFARMDSTHLHSFDEDAMAAASGANARSIDEIIEELETVRKSTIQLYKSFTAEMLLFEGTASGKKINALALGFVIAGHQTHHFNILKERYL